MKIFDGLFCEALAAGNIRESPCMDTRQEQSERDPNAVPVLGLHINLLLEGPNNGRVRMRTRCVTNNQLAASCRQASSILCFE